MKTLGYLVCYLAADYIYPLQPNSQLFIRFFPNLG
jgi:hypothetical protein